MIKFLKIEIKIQIALIALQVPEAWVTLPGTDLSVPLSFVTWARCHLFAVVHLLLSRLLVPSEPSQWQCQGSPEGQTCLAEKGFGGSWCPVGIFPSSALPLQWHLFIYDSPGLKMSG